MFKKTMINEFEFKKAKLHSIQYNWNTNLLAALKKTIIDRSIYSLRHLIYIKDDSFDLYFFVDKQDGSLKMITKSFENHFEITNVEDSLKSTVINYFKMKNNSDQNDIVLDSGKQKSIRLSNDYLYLYYKYLDSSYRELANIKVSTLNISKISQIDYLSGIIVFRYDGFDMVIDSLSTKNSVLLYRELVRRTKTIL